MTSITLFEHSFRSHSDLAQDGWQERHTNQLELLNEQLSKNVSGQRDTIVEVERKGIKSNHHVGIIRIGDKSLQILPKIDYETGINQSYSATHNLLYMLSYVNNLNLRMRDINSLKGDKSDWFEILTGFFASELHTLFRRGVERQYVNIEENLPVVKGRWLLQQQIIRQAGVKHRFEVSYDELSPDTPLNRVFKYVVTTLLPITRDAMNIRLLHELRDWLLDVKLLTDVRQEQLNQVNFTRLNERFLPAFNLARLFIEHRAPTLLTGELTSFAFVFNMNQLFQEFVARFIQQHWRMIVPKLWEHIEVTQQAKGRAVYLLEKQGANRQLVLKLEPDLLFGGTPPRLIADTKYKRLKPDEKRLGVSEADLYQMLAYSVRFKCRNVLLIYPSIEGIDSTKLYAKFNVPEQDTQFTVATVDLHHSLQDHQVLLNQLTLILNPLLSEAYGIP